MASNLAYAIPAIAAATAYANAKLRISPDCSFLADFILGTAAFNKRDKVGRGCIFYKLEEHVADPKISDKTFLIYEGKSWTFKQFYDEILHYAGWLHRTHHIQPNEIIALDFMNCPEFLFLVVASWSLGAIPAFINSNLVGKPFLHSVKVSTARLLLIEQEVAARALSDDARAELGAELEIGVFTPELVASLAYFPPYRAPDSARANLTADQAAALIYTSGTTGNPKAAIVPWVRVGIGGDCTARFLGLRSVKQTRPDRFYTPMPLYHSTAFALGFNACLQNATTFVVSRKFSVGNFWNEIRENDVTVIQYVGETLRYLLAAPPSSSGDKNHKVRMAFGNGLRPDVWKAFKARFGVETIAEIYGATEATSAKWNINRNDFSDGAINTAGAIGKLMSHFNEAIVRVDWDTENPWRDPRTGLCRRVDYNEAGELLYKLDPAELDSKFRGYFGNPEASQSKIVRDVLVKGDAYFRTGDTVKVDREGRTWFSDRIGDTFRWRSENVSTNEVSEVIGYHNAVVEANVYGVTVPGHEGRAGCAAILLKDEALVGGKKSVEVRPEVLESLATFASNGLPKYAVPLFLRVVREITVTGNNKQQKNALRNQGIELGKIQQAGSDDRMYWLKPGAGKYVEFTDRDLDSLRTSQVKL